MPEGEAMMTAEKAVSMVVGVFPITERELMTRRTAKAAAARKVVYHILRDAGWPPERIGWYMVGRERTTILHALGMRPGHRRRRNEPD